MTLAGLKGTSTFAPWFFSQSKRLSTSLGCTSKQSQFLTMDSSKTRTEYGRWSENHTMSTSHLLDMQDIILTISGVIESSEVIVLVLLTLDGQSLQGFLSKGVLLACKAATSNY
jgi:hypothetical protein